MTLHQMTIASIVGIAYGTLFSFLNDFSIVIVNNFNSDYYYNKLFNSCNVYANIMFASYAYYYIMTKYSWLFLQSDHKIRLETLIYFGFVYPSFIIYPSELTCAIYTPHIHYVLHRILISPATMIFILTAFESFNFHYKLIELFYK
jgi:hypothetical protein